MPKYKSWQVVPLNGWRWKNFSPRELACKGTGELVVDEAALDKLQALRDAVQRPMIVTSAYRSPEHNAAVGGAKNSFHLDGKAFDIRMDNFDPYEFMIEARNCGFTGFGHYPKQGFMHIDTGPARMWGNPFPRGETGLTMEPPGRQSVAQSTTLQAAMAQITGSLVAAVTAVQALDGVTQAIVLGFAGLILLSAMWIARERFRKWAEGYR